MDKYGYYQKWGLYLPFRFYESRTQISEASDHARKVVIPKTEYILMPYGVLLPFQIVRPYSATRSPIFTIYCIGSGEEDPLTINIDIRFNKYEDNEDIESMTFLGLFGDAEIPAGSYFAKFEDGTGREWFSDNFTVVADEFDVTFRKWSSNTLDLRVSGTDLRIV
jgi:hypothetical protein